MSAFAIRELRELDELAAACELFDQIWGFEDGALSILREIMRGYAYEGNYVTGAFLGDVLVGASVGHFGPPHSRALLSYVTGAVKPHAGLELKLHQRRWAMDHGIERIIWTFDPLVRRNAHFNLAKLGARAEAYLENHYGHMPDAINGQDQSDRIRVVWHITEPDVREAVERGRPAPIKVPADAQRLLAVRPDGGRKYARRTPRPSCSKCPRTSRERAWPAPISPSAGAVRCGTPWAGWSRTAEPSSGFTTRPATWSSRSDQGGRAESKSGGSRPCRENPHRPSPRGP